MILANTNPISSIYDRFDHILYLEYETRMDLCKFRLSCLLTNRKGSIASRETCSAILVALRAKSCSWIRTEEVKK